jgi:hypothetical protein
VTLEELRNLKVGDQVVATIRRFGQSPGLTPVFEVGAENAGLVSLTEEKLWYSWVRAREIEIYRDRDEEIRALEELVGTLRTEIARTEGEGNGT